MNKSPALDSAALSPEEGAELRSLLEHLRWKRNIKFTEIAHAAALDVDDIHKVTGGRSPGTHGLRESIRKYCSTLAIDWRNYDKDAAFGFDFVMDRLEITPDRIEASVEACAGSYLLYNETATGYVVSWYELLRSNERFPIPPFTAWRVDNQGNEVKFSGFYYQYQKTLFLLGHMVDTPYPRTIFLVPVGGKSKDRYGVISGASMADILFASPCYLERLDDAIHRRECDAIGEYDRDTFENRFPDVTTSLKSRGPSSIFVRRPSGG